MKDIIDLVGGYWALKALKRKGFIKDSDFNLSFSEFIVRSLKAIKDIEEVHSENK